MITRGSIISTVRSLVSRKINLIDVGSFGGLPVEWKQNKHHIGFLMNFEPRDKPIKSGDVITMNTALWSDNTTKDFYIHSQGAGSSLYVQNYDYVRENWETLKNIGSIELAKTWFDRSTLERTEKIECRKLDDVIEEQAPTIQFDFLKIDAQGAEFEIIKGADKLLSGSCMGLMLELFTIPMYKGITLLPDVAEYLSKKGFTLIKIFPSPSTFNAANDCLFIKEGSDKKISSIIYKIYGV